MGKTVPAEIDRVPASRYRPGSGATQGEVAPGAPELASPSGPDDYVRYALYHSPQVEAAYERWLAAAERLPQVRALPDPRLTLARDFQDEMTSFGVMQSFPWPGTLRAREDAAARAAFAAWRRFEAAQLAVAERVLSALHELAYLDEATRIARRNLELLVSFEEIVRARYRVGTGSHPELIRVQVALGQLEDRLVQLDLMRPPLVAELNAALNRPPLAEVPLLEPLPERLAGMDADALEDLARRANPMLLALDEQAEEQRRLADVARRSGLPDLTVGVEYMNSDSSMPDAGEPFLLSLGIRLPLWRGRYEAAVSEVRARSRSLIREREEEGLRLAAAIRRAWFEHTDAHRRVGLYEESLIPKAEESLRASLAGFRAGDTSFLSLLDTERTLLEFELVAERARTDRGKALARLQTLVGTFLPIVPAPTVPPTESQP